MLDLRACAAWVLSDGLLCPRAELGVCGVASAAAAVAAPANVAGSACRLGGLAVASADVVCVDAGPWVRYVRSLLWAVVTASSTGFGDIVARNAGEQLYVCMCACVAREYGFSTWPRADACWCGSLVSGQ